MPRPRSGGRAAGCRACGQWPAVLSGSSFERAAHALSSARGRSSAEGRRASGINGSGRVRIGKFGLNPARFHVIGRMAGFPGARALIAAAALLAAWSAGAVGLGEISVRSHLGQPLLAEVSLPADDHGSLQVRPAPMSSYAQHGMEAPGKLGRIDTEVVRKAGGRRVLRVTSERPVNEPIVQLLVQARDQSGRLDRQLTVLVNPTRYGENADSGTGARARAAAGARKAHAPTAGTGRHSAGKQTVGKTKSKKAQHAASRAAAHRHRPAASAKRVRRGAASGARAKKARPRRFQTGSGGIAGASEGRHAPGGADGRRVR